MGLPERLRRTRKRAGLSQRQVSILASCDAGTVNNIESGGRSRIDMVEALAAALKVPVYWLAFGPEAHLPFRQIQLLKDEAYRDPGPHPDNSVLRERFGAAAATLQFSF